jgi:predicted nucleic acid binding AN1-type Zn finger protein
MSKNKCFNCKKSLKLINYTCKCNYTFCQKCRLPESHNCTYDFKLKGKEYLKENLIKVEAKKIIKI